MIDAGDARRFAKAFIRQGMGAAVTVLRPGPLARLASLADKAAREVAR